MDSNRKFINFQEVLLTEEETNPIVIPCGNIKRAEEILKKTKLIAHTKLYCRLE